MAGALIFYVLFVVRKVQCEEKCAHLGAYNLLHSLNISKFKIFQQEMNLKPLKVWGVPLKYILQG